MPSQLGLTNAEKLELLTFHRAKKARERICPECKDALQQAEQECYWCGNKFSDKWGVHGAFSIADFLGIEKEGGEDAKAERARKLAASLGGRGMIFTEEPLQLSSPLNAEDAKAMRKRLGID